MTRGACRGNLSGRDLRGIGIEVRRQLVARDMSDVLLDSILRHINSATGRLSGEIRELRSELVAERVDVVSDGGHGCVHGIEAPGEEREPLAQRARPLVGVGRVGRVREQRAGLGEIGSIAHMITSFLCVGALIFSLRNRGKR